jgi:CRISPR-associated endonuclease/helicase Cas3
MCGAHRKAVIAHIKERLKAKREGRDSSPLRVVSTQLVEAGVDMDFPVVYRALAGLDSIAQAAGRCNREGRCRGKGRVVVFVPPERPPLGHLRKGADACISVLHGQRTTRWRVACLSAISASSITRWTWMQKASSNLLKVNDRKTLAVQFRTAADAFRLIDDQDQRHRGGALRSAASDEIDKLLAPWPAEGPQRWLMRKLQRYTVSIPKRLADQMLAQGT